MGNNWWEDNYDGDWGWSGWAPKDPEYQSGQRQNPTPPENPPDPVDRGNKNEWSWGKRVANDWVQPKAGPFYEQAGTIRTDARRSSREENDEVRFLVF